jgi:hypothetical protein
MGVELLLTGEATGLVGQPTDILSCIYITNSPAWIKLIIIVSQAFSIR